MKFLLLIWMLASALVAQAHTRSETQSSWQVGPNGANAELLVPEIEARRMLGNEDGKVDGHRLGWYLQDAVTVKAGDEDCQRAQAPQQLMATNGYYRITLAWRCPAQPTEAHWAELFAKLPNHRHFATVREPAGQRTEHLLDASQSTLKLDAEPTLQDAGMADFLRLGMEHIFTGPDHQAFLLGLVLLAPRLRDLVFVITGFTLGHSLTLGLAVLGWMKPTENLNDALVGVTIALLGAEIAVHRLGAARGVAAAAAGLLLAAALGGIWLERGPPPLLLGGLALFAGCYLLLSPKLVHAARMRLLVTLVFGLVHGFTFAASLVNMGLPRGRLGELLLGFNCGVELAQLLLVSGAWALAAALARTRWKIAPAMAADVGLCALTGLGLYWALLRGYAGA